MNKYSAYPETTIQLAKIIKQARLSQEYSMQKAAGLKQVVSGARSMVGRVAAPIINTVVGGGKRAVDWAKAGNAATQGIKNMARKNLPAPIGVTLRDPTLSEKAGDLVYRSGKWVAQHPKTAIGVGAGFGAGAGGYALGNKGKSTLRNQLSQANQKFDQLNTKYNDLNNRLSSAENKSVWQSIIDWFYQLLGGKSNKQR